MNKLKDYIYRRCNIIYSRAFGNGTVNDQSEKEILTTEEAENICKFINQNYISKEQILNLECLKEESESGWKGNSFDNTGNGNKSVRNNLRKEIKEEITKDLFKDFKQVSNPLDEDYE